jgi:hypothetical protein
LLIAGGEAEVTVGMRGVLGAVNSTPGTALLPPDQQAAPKHVITPLAQARPPRANLAPAPVLSQSRDPIRVAAQVYPLPRL